jgi:hypothetical protein
MANGADVERVISAIAQQRMTERPDLDEIVAYPSNIPTNR